MAPTIDERLDQVYQSGGERAKLDEAYNDWARSYDQDVWGSGNPYIALMSGLAGRYIQNREAAILDAGCGTGNMAALLYLLGYRNLTGIDASAGMLAAAEAKGIYRNLHQGLLGESIKLPSEHYDALTAAGVLTHGHAPPESLRGLLTLLKPGAPIIFSISKIAVEDGGYGPVMAALEAEGAWVLEEQTAPFQTYPFSETHSELRHWVYVYRKTP